MESLYEIIKERKNQEFEAKLRAIVAQIEYPIWDYIGWREFQELRDRENVPKTSFVCGEAREDGECTVHYMDGIIIVKTFYFIALTQMISYYLIRPRKIFTALEFWDVVKKADLRHHTDFVKEHLDDYKEPIILESSNRENKQYMYANHDKGHFGLCGGVNDGSCFIKYKDRISIAKAGKNIFLIKEKGSL